MALPGAPYLHSAASSLSSGLAEEESCDIWDDSNASKSNAVAVVGWVVVVRRNMLDAAVAAVVRVFWNRLLRLVEISSSSSEKFLFACNDEKLLRFRRRQLCSMVIALNAWERPRSDPRMKIDEIVASLVVVMMMLSRDRESC